MWMAGTGCWAGGKREKAAELMEVAPDNETSV